MTWIERVNNFLSIRQILYLLLLAIVLGILLHPLGVPIGIADSTRVVYTYVQNLPQNPKMLIDLHYEFAASTELQPATGAFLRQLITKSPKLVIFSSHSEGPVMFERLKAYVPDVFSQLKYGEDYVYLGFITGGETAIASLARGVREFAAKDNYGTLTVDMPIFKTVDKGPDLTLAVAISSLTSVPEQFVRQLNTPYKTPILFLVAALIGPSVQPFVESKQAVGMIAGQNQAAQYELLIHRPASAVAASDAQSGAHVLIIIYIVLGNLIYWPMRIMRKKDEGKRN